MFQCVQLFSFDGVRLRTLSALVTGKSRRPHAVPTVGNKHNNQQSDNTGGWKGGRCNA